jgi:hypothetical protein
MTTILVDETAPGNSRGALLKKCFVLNEDEASAENNTPGRHCGRQNWCVIWEQQ